MLTYQLQYLSIYHSLNVFIGSCWYNAIKHTLPTPKKHIKSHTKNHINIFWRLTLRHLAIVHQLFHNAYDLVTVLCYWDRNNRKKLPCPSSQMRCTTSKNTTNMTLNCSFLHQNVHVVTYNVKSLEEMVINPGATNARESFQGHRNTDNGKQIRTH